MKNVFLKNDELKIHWLLLAVIVIGFYLRLGGISSGLIGEIKSYPNPDEINFVNTAFRMLQTSNYNPHPFWVYPTLYIYFQAGVQLFVYLVSVGTKIIIPEFMNAVGPHHYYYFFGRFATTLFGTASIFVLYKLAKELFDRKVGLVAASLLSVTFAHIWASQYVTTDVPMTFFGLMSIYYSAKILKKDDSWKNFLMVGLFIGLALATRYNAFVFIVTFLVSYFISHVKKEKLFPYFSLQNISYEKLALCLIFPFLVFFVIDPYVFLDLPHFLASYTGFIRAYKQGIWLQLSVYDNMPAWLWYLKYAATSGLYWPLFLAVLGGLTFGLWPLTKAKVFILSFLVANFLLISSMATVTDRNLVQMSPYLNIFAAIFVFKFCEFLSRTRALKLIFLSLFLILLFGLNIFRAVTYDLAINRQDTRLRAAYWLEGNLPKEALVVGIGVDQALWYLSQNGFPKTFSVATLGPSYERIIDKTKGDHYVVITSVDYNWPRQYYRSSHHAPWSFDGLMAKQIFDCYQQLKRKAVLVKEISDPLFKSGFYGPGYLEMSSTVTIWHNPTVEIYRVSRVE